jgi:hypothetical protein
MTKYNLEDEMAKTKRLLVAQGDYSSTATCRAKIPAIFRGIFGFFRGISKFLFIYSTISRQSLVGKHCVRHERVDFLFWVTKLFNNWALAFKTKA